MSNVSLGDSKERTTQIVNTSPYAPQAKKYTKLEVISARKVNQLIYVHYAIVSLVFMFDLFVIIASNTMWKSHLSLSRPDGSTVRISSYIIPTVFRWANDIIEIVFFFLQVLLLIFYAVPTFTKDDVTEEQKWVFMLLLGNVIYMFPFFEIVDIYRQLDENANELYRAKWFKIVEPFFQTFRHAGYSMRTLFYYWATVHSYRIVDKKPGYWFYAPKLLVLIVYNVLKAAFAFLFQVYTAEIRLATIAGMIRLYATSGVWLRAGIWAGVVFTIFELIILGASFYESRKTRLKLRTLDYVKYRSKQIGYRFFNEHNLKYNIIHDLMFVMNQVFMPNALKVERLLDVQQQLSIFGHDDIQCGHHLLLLVHAFIEAYVRLPAETDGFLFWLFTHQNDRSYPVPKPIMYKRREKLSVSNSGEPMNHSNCFVMETHVAMFNFSWLVYWSDRRIIDEICLENHLFKYRISEKISDEETDSHVLVVDGEDRIVLAFRGTTSTQNLRTDANLFFTSLTNVVPTRSEDNKDAELSNTDNMSLMDIPQILLMSRQWRSAKVHRGFGAAYRAVAPRVLNAVNLLLDRKVRPVFLTGHSLGGALATLCSLDLHLSLNVPSSEIIVSTFGSPRVGNTTFRKLYEDIIYSNWRVNMQQDLVTKLPKFGYSHVGKSVVLTQAGDLFLDPNSLELNIWSGEKVSVSFHTKTSYQLAMHAWCDQAHDDQFDPGFWFEVSNCDPLRKRITPRSRKVNRLSDREISPPIALDVIINLDNAAFTDDTMDPRVNSIRNWRRLTELVLQRSQDLSLS